MLALSQTPIFSERTLLTFPFEVGVKPEGGPRRDSTKAPDQRGATETGQLEQRKEVGSKVSVRDGGRGKRNKGIERKDG